MPDFVTLPEADRFVLRNVALPLAITESILAAGREGLAPADMVIGNGKIETITAPGATPADLPSVDLKGGQVWPCFVDMHTHLDKGHIWPRQPNPDGTFMGALETVGQDREANWTAEDIATRMDFALRCAYAHGTKLIRTHLDSLPPHHIRTWEVFADMRDRWAGRIDLQAAALFPFDMIWDEPYFAEMVASVSKHGGALGGVTQMSVDLDKRLDKLFKAASDADLNVDLHVDETADKEARTLEAVAEAVLRNKYEGQVVVGHCCSLAQQDEADAQRIVAKTVEAGLNVVSLPLCNMYLQDRHAGRTPRWRGVTLVHELMAAGANVSIASDNTRDPFYAYGDLDPLEVFREGVRILHLDHPIDSAIRLMTAHPAKAIGRNDLGWIKAGNPADLILFTARGWTELLSRPQSDRIVLRNGKAVDRTLPDYRELDDILGVQ